MTTDEIKARLEQSLPGLRLKKVRDSLLVENPEDLVKTAQLLKNDPLLKMDFLSSITGADYLTYLETVYHFYSTELKAGPVTLRVRAKREAPKVPSLTPLYRSAELQEREAYDMFGIIFEGHPDLRRLFMWDQFEGWPLRKDYEQEDSDILEAADVAWLDQNNIPVPEKLRTRALELKAQGKRASAVRPSQNES